jgi:hypothetical protein
MMLMNKLIGFGIYMIFSFCAVAQTVVVKGAEESIDGEPVQGYVTELEGKKDDVLNAWNKYLKVIGRVRISDHIIISDPSLSGTLFPKKTIHSLLTEKGDRVLVWIGIKKKEWSSNDIAGINTDLENHLHRFGIKYYQDKIQGHIDETQQASDAVAKQKHRLETQATDLGFSLQNNEKQKITLEKALADNKLQNAMLLLKIANNKKAQDSLINAGQQIQKVKASHEDLQKKVQ